ncbi:MAG: hypothetical protein AAB383_03195 [Patescibacteria group bacterium]
MQNTIRYGLFLLIVTGALFTGCESEVVDPEMELPTNEEVEEATGIDTDLDGDTDAETDEAEANTTSGSTTTPQSEPAEESSVYEDGSYAASGSYASPAGPESVGVTLTVKNDLVTSVSVVKNAINPTSVNFQELFASGISGQVVGKSLDEIGNYSSINGSSLTPNGFDAALASIKADAAL